MQSHIWKAENLDELKTTAEQILNRFPGNRIFILNGDLGAGKTALVKAFAEVLGVQEQVSSPTFSIVHEYSGANTVFHFDLYRLNDTNDLLQIGFEEYIYSGAFVFIEWPAIALPLLEENYVEISISVEQIARIIACTSIKIT